MDFIDIIEPFGERKTRTARGVEGEPKKKYSLAMDLKCPRCDSKEHYIATRQKFKGIGIFFRASNIKVALCRKCGETMHWQNQDLGKDSPDGSKK